MINHIYYFLKEIIVKTECKQAVTEWETIFLNFIHYISWLRIHLCTASQSCISPFFSLWMKQEICK